MTNLYSQRGRNRTGKREHVLVAEAALGRRLPKGAEVHHVDGDGWNNQPQNLVICQDHAFHHLLHVRQRAFEATGDPSKRKCPVCKAWDDPVNMASRRNGRMFRHRECERSQARANSRRRKEVSRG